MNIGYNQIGTFEHNGRNQLISKELFDLRDKDLYFRSNNVHHFNTYNKEYDLISSQTVSVEVLDLLLIGVNLIGEKTSVVITGINLYVDVLITKPSKAYKAKCTPEQYAAGLKIYHSKVTDNYIGQLREHSRTLNQYQQIRLKSTSIVKSKNIREHRKNSNHYLRLFFFNNKDRCAAIDYFHNKRVNTCSNEKCKTNFSRIAGRIYDIKYGDDMLLKNAERCEHKSINIDNQFTLDVNKIEYVNIGSITNPLTIQLLQKRKFMLMGWDTEVHSHFGKEVKAQVTDTSDPFKCINLSFFWLFDDKPCKKISLIYKYVPPSSDITTIICNSQEEIMMAMADIWRVMQPDYCIGFNDGEYDWPKMIYSLETLKSPRSYEAFLHRFYSTASCYTPKKMAKMNKFDLDGGLMPKSFKLGSGLKIESKLFSIPGCISLDVRNLLRKFYVGAEATNLKFYLKVNNLPPKKDMSIARMFYIFDEGVRLDKMPIIRDLRDGISKDPNHWFHKVYYSRKVQYDAAVETGEIDFETLNGKLPLDNSVRRANIVKFMTSLLPNNPGLQVVIDNVDALLDYADYLIGMFDVRTYCDTDAESCILLFHKLFAYQDASQMASLANISILDCYWKADGMKVTNFICKYAHVDNYLVDLLYVEPKEDAKYPGAYVIYPKSGHYKLKPKKFYDANMKAIEDINRILNDLEAECDKDMAPKDEVLLKLARLREFLPDKDKPAITSIMQTVLAVDDECKLYNIDKILTATIALNKLGFPIVALDFTSLYPNVIRTYNLSPELIIKNPVKAQKYIDKGWQLHKISFKYGTKDILAWSIIADPQGNRLEGIYGKILRDLFNLRVEVRDLLKLNNRTKLEREGKKGTPEWQEADFLYKSIDSKQKAIKVIMNTLYGKAGDTTGPLFMPEISGGTTVMGQYNLRLVDKFITKPPESLIPDKLAKLKVMINNNEVADNVNVNTLIQDIIDTENGVDTIYGDTDSVYTMFKYPLFKKDYQLWVNGQITLLEYSSRMVSITMTQIDILKHKVGAMLIKDNGAKHLSMAYEEVLYPAVFVIKKKYCGTEHKDKVSFDMVHRFEKGFLTKKIGFSPFAKNTIDTILTQLLDLYSETDPLEIVVNTTDKLFVVDWKIDDFTQSVAWKPKADGKAGNVKVNTFIKRMRIEGREDPMPFSRFKYIIVRKYPFKFDIKGRKGELTVGDKMEYPEVAKAQGYEVDIFHYVSKSLLAEMAAIVSVESQFKVIPESTDEEAVKAAYEESLKVANKYLNTYIKKYMFKYTTTQGTIFKYLYKEVYKEYMRTIKSNIDDISVPNFNILFNVDFLGTACVFESWIKRMDKMASDRAKRWVKEKKVKGATQEFSRLQTKDEQVKYKKDIIEFIKRSKEGISYQVSKYQPTIDALTTEAYTYKEKYKPTYFKYVKKIKKNIKNIRVDLNIETSDLDDANELYYKMLIEKIRSIKFDIEVSDEDRELISRLVQINQQIIDNKWRLIFEQIGITQLEEWVNSLAI